MIPILCVYELWYFDWRTLTLIHLNYTFCDYTAHMRELISAILKTIQTDSNNGEEISAIFRIAVIQRRTRVLIFCVPNSNADWFFYFLLSPCRNRSQSMSLCNPIIISADNNTICTVAKSSATLDVLHVNDIENFKWFETLCCAQQYCSIFPDDLYIYEVDTYDANASLST